MGEWSTLGRRWVDASFKQYLSLPERTVLSCSYLAGAESKSAVAALQLGRGSGSGYRVKATTSEVFDLDAF